MLTKEEKRNINIQFWDGFQKYMRKFRSSNGRRMNWINYPTDTKFLYVRLEIDKNSARMCFDIQPKDQGVKDIVYEQCQELKVVLESEMKWETNWVEHFETQDGRSIARIYWEIQEVNLYQPETHERIKTFFADRLREFDIFYQEYKEILITLIN